VKQKFHILIIAALVFLLGGICEEAGAQAVAAKKQAATQNVEKTPPVKQDTVFFELPDSGNYKADRPSYDELPEFPGGQDAMNEFILANTVYPKTAVDDKIEGRVFMRFAIETDGTLTDIRVFIGVRNDINDECMRVMKLMPKWKPGTTVMKATKGWYRTPTKWMYSIPFTFSLTSDESSSNVIIRPK
jgi:hypothetical protein